jgi:hypothetical protein
MSIKVLKDLWNQFFFKEINPEIYGIFRIVFGILILFNFIFELNNLNDFYGPNAIISLESVKGQFQYPHFNLFNLLAPTETSLYIITTIYGIGVIGFLLGFFSNFSALLAFMGMMSFHHRNIWLLSSCDLLMRLLLLILIFAPIGEALSVDNIIRRIRGKISKEKVSYWSMRLIQIHIAVLYVSTVIAKIKGDTWFDGTALYYASRLEDMLRFPTPFILDNIWSIKILTWGTLILEFALGTFIWFKEFRYPLLIIGVIFHLGIEYMMTIPFFEILMIVSLISFVYPEDVYNFCKVKFENMKNGIISSQVDQKVKNFFLKVIG